MNDQLNQRGHSIVIGLVGVIGIVILVTLGIVFAGQHAKVQSEKDRIASQTATTEEQTGQIQRDKVRYQHAMDMANRLTTQVLMTKQSVATTQAGLATIAKGSDNTLLLDPSTNKPYVFASTQSKMKVGEATFRTSATCDNKTTSADGRGMIVDATASSVAVAIKLEAGGYACETNL